MSATCFNHPDIWTEATCSQCGAAVCNNCKEDIAGQSVCSRCVGAIRTRLEAELNGGATAAKPPATSNQTVAAVAAIPPDSVHPGLRMLLGVLAGLLVGIAGAFLWEKITFYSHFNIGYLTALIGFGVGYAMVFGSRRTGMVPAILGAVIALAAQLFGYYLLIGDEILQQMPGAGPIPVSYILSQIAHSIDPIGWIILAIGVYGGFKTPMRAGGHK